MKLGARKPGTSTSFVDGVDDEALLQFSWNEAGVAQIAFHIYDASGTLVADSGGISPATTIHVTSVNGEILLDVPLAIEESISYRLYNRRGRLLTWSDGAQTQIYGFLRMEAKRAWLPT